MKSPAKSPAALLVPGRAWCQENAAGRHARLVEHLKKTAAEITARSLADIRTRAAWEEKRPSVRRELLYMLGLDPLPERTPLAGTPVPGAMNVRCDNDEGIRQLVRHLVLDHGYKELGYLSGRIDSPDNQARAKAIEAEAIAQALCMTTADFTRAFEAFSNKAKPVFQGN